MRPLKRKSSTAKLGEKWKLTKSKSMSGRKKNSKKRLADIVDEATKSDREDGNDESSKEQKMTEEEKKKQEEEKKARFPIAPDGYLPNSVIRKIIKPPANTSDVPENTEEPWRLKPVPKMDSQNQPGTLSRLSDYDVTLYLSETTMSNAYDDAEERGQDYDEMTAVQTHQMSRESTSVPGQEQFSSGQQNLLTSEATTLSKGRPLFSNMSQQATLAISEEAHNGSDLLKHIAEEAWFPAEMDVTLTGVVNAFISIIDDVSLADHNQICDYIIKIHQEIGYPDQLMDKLAEKLMEQLSSPIMDKRIHVLRVISQLKLNSRSIIEEILTVLADPAISDELHQLAEVTLINLTGANDQEMLDKKLDELGITDKKYIKQEQVQRGDMEEGVEPQNTSDDMCILPEATQDQLVETWLEGTKGVEKDLTGLYREELCVSKKNSGHSKSNSSSRNSSHSHDSSRSEASHHTDASGRSTPKESLKDKLTVPNTEKDKVIKSHIGIPNNNKLTPDNPLMYKLYDSQKQALTSFPEKSTKITRFEDSVQSAAERTVVEDDSACRQEIDSPSCSHDKSSAMRPGTTNLSPVQGSDDKNTDSINHQEVNTENWRVLLDEARKQKEQPRPLRDDAAKTTKEPINLPPIRYLGDDIVLTTTDSGQRLLHSVSVKSRRQDSAGSSESGSSHKHKIHPLPGRLGTNTTREGYSKYGILTMQWTAGTPVCGQDCQRYLLHHYNKQLTTTSGSKSVTTLKYQLYNLHVTSDISPESYSRTTSSNTKFLPALVSNPESLYEWAQPVVSLDVMKPTTSSALANRESKHYCDYSRLLKKRMHDHISVTESSPLYLPKPAMKTFNSVTQKSGAVSTSSFCCVLGR